MKEQIKHSQTFLFFFLILSPTPPPPRERIDFFNTSMCLWNTLPYRMTFKPEGYSDLFLFFFFKEKEENATSTLLERVEFMGRMLYMQTCVSFWAQTWYEDAELGKCWLVESTNSSAPDF